MHNIMYFVEGESTGGDGWERVENKNSLCFVSVSLGVFLFHISNIGKEVKSGYISREKV